MNNKASTPSTFFRLLVLLLCIFGMAWTCRAMLSGHRVRDYTFEEAMMLLGDDDKRPAACAALREKITEAIGALRSAGDDGDVAVQAIHKETSR